MDSDPRRAYLAKHAVEPAVTAAITKVLEKQPVEPVMEVGRCLIDAAYTVPAGKTMVPVLDYVATHGVKQAVSDAIKVIATEMPAEPVLAIGRKLAAGGASPMSEYMSYWAPSTFGKSAMSSEAAYNSSLTMPLGKRCMVERAARGVVDPDVPQSEYMAYWAPRTFDTSAMMDEAGFSASKKLPWGKRCMLERAARGYAELDTMALPRSEFLDYWAPRDFKDSALPTAKIFMETLMLPDGARAMAEREARGIADPSITKRSEYDEYWAPRTFALSAIRDEASYAASLATSFGERCMAERAARGVVDPDVPQSEYMAYWAPRTYKESAMAKEADFVASKAFPCGKRCTLEREARGYVAFDEGALTPRSEYLDYWAPTDFKASALKTESAFAASLKLPMGERAMMERAARAA